MKIYFDMDDVGNELNKYLYEVYNKDFNDNRCGRDSDCFYIEHNPGIKASAEYFIEILATEGVFINLKPNQGYIDIIEKLIDENYDVRILTYPQWKSKYCMNEKVEWIRRHLPFVNLDNLIFTRLKEEVAAENRILIDDNPSHLKKWEENGGIGVAYGKNKYTDNWNGYRVNNFEEFYQLIKQLEKDKNAFQLIKQLEKDNNTLG